MTALAMKAKIAEVSAIQSYRESSTFFGEIAIVIIAVKKPALPSAVPATAKAIIAKKNPSDKSTSVASIKS